jgi:hypothetical protein
MICRLDRDVVRKPRGRREVERSLCAYKRNQATELRESKAKKKRQTPNSANENDRREEIEEQINRPSDRT